MTERTADGLIEELGRARTRLEQAEKRFHEASPLVSAVAPGEELPRVLPQDILERGSTRGSGTRASSPIAEAPG